MNFFSDVYGNHKQKAYFSSLIREGKYAHAYILEPPAGVYMLLLCENSLALLSTVRSRAQKISLERFDEPSLLAYAEKTGLARPGDVIVLISLVILRKQTST